MSLRFALLTASLMGSAAAQTPASAPPPPEPRLPSGMQWLYGSGEGGAASIQAYHAFRDFVIARAEQRPQESVVLAADATLDSPDMVPCGDLPLAVVLDVDETAIQNLGYEFDEASNGRSYDQERWNRWEQTGGNAVLPMPGAVTALQSIRNHGVTVVFNSNRQAVNDDETQAAIEAAGLGPAV
ncbi:MAG TPA: HAD family acid phosphatase, partial [Allosphingosinicella sp.]|nr:HAD family acid phosphatase [Allosphingosinicella sp.]